MVSYDFINMVDSGKPALPQWKLCPWCVPFNIGSLLLKATSNKLYFNVTNNFIKQVITIFSIVVVNQGFLSCKIQFKQGDK